MLTGRRNDQIRAFSNGNGVAAAPEAAAAVIARGRRHGPGIESKSSCAFASASSAFTAVQPSPSHSAFQSKKRGQMAPIAPIA